MEGTQSTEKFFILYTIFWHGVLFFFFFFHLVVEN
jgi:hypothetical protein